MCECIYIKYTGKHKIYVYKMNKMRMQSIHWGFTTLRLLLQQYQTFAMGKCSFSNVYHNIYYGWMADWLLASGSNSSGCSCFCSKSSQKQNDTTAIPFLKLCSFFLFF